MWSENEKYDSWIPEARMHIQKITLTIFNILAFFSHDFLGADWDPGMLWAGYPTFVKIAHV